mgnify:CR=1 FL=1
MSLLEEQSKRVTADPSQYGSASSGDGDHHSTGGAAVKSITKQVLVGDVPDRGGRANEVRSKQLQQDIRRTFGGHGGGGKSTASTHNSGDREKKDDGHGGDSGKKEGGVVQEGVGEQGQEVLNSGSNSSTARRKGKGSNREKSRPQEAQDRLSTATITTGKAGEGKKAIERRPSTPATTATGTITTGTTNSAAGGATRVTTIIGTNQSNSSNTGRTVNITVQDLVPDNQVQQQQQGAEKQRKPRHRNRHKASSSQENST